jgi:hypothetical protein
MEAEGFFSVEATPDVFSAGRTTGLFDVRKSNRFLCITVFGPSRPVAILLVEISLRNYTPETTFKILVK